MNAKQKVELGHVQETLLIPLYGRACEMKKRAPLLHDPKALEIVESIDYDFGKFDGAWSLLGASVRTALFDQWVKAFLDAHPEGTVVEIGAGLNTRFERLDNGRLRWFDIDLPDSMALRRRFFSDTDRRTMIAASVLDESWVEPVLRTEGPFMLVAEAVLLYLSETQVKQALGLIAKHFPGSAFTFDTANRWMVDNQHRHDVMKKMDATFRWACDDPASIEGWGLGYHLDATRRVMDLDPAIERHLPLHLRLAFPLVRRFYRQWADAYRLNLFHHAAAVHA